MICPCSIKAFIVSLQTYINAHINAHWCHNKWCWANVYLPFISFLCYLQVRDSIPKYHRYTEYFHHIHVLKYIAKYESPLPTLNMIEYVCTFTSYLQLRNKQFPKTCFWWTNGLSVASRTVASYRPMDDWRSDHKWLNKMVIVKLRPK